MSEKSHVTMEQEVCVVCCDKYDTGSLLLDRRLRKTFERYTVTGWGLCPKCQKLKDDGYVALVGCRNPNVDGRLKPEEADRSGNIAYLRLTKWFVVFNVEPPAGGVAFCADEVVQRLIDQAEGRSA